MRGFIKHIIIIISIIILLTPPNINPDTASPTAFGLRKNMQNDKQINITCMI